MNIRVRVAAIIEKNGSILLAKHKKGDEEYWLLPGGGVEPTESLTEALKREITEEVSLDVEVGELVFVNDSISPTRDRHIVQIVFKCKVIGGVFKVNPDHRLYDAEYIEVDKIQKLKMRPAIANELTALLKSQEVDNNVYLGKIWE